MEHLIIFIIAYYYHYDYITMSSPVNNKITYPKWSDFATKDNFELPRLQLIELIDNNLVK